MALLTLRQIKVTFGGPPLLDGVDLQIEPGERICLVGRNGAGKSTLLRLISGEIEAESGEFVRRQGTRVAKLDQEVPDGADGTIYDVVAEGLGQVGALLREYHACSLRLAAGDEKAMNALEGIQHRLESQDGWSAGNRVETVISKLGLNPDVAFATLSGGMKRRVMLARALVEEPDILLLDEPTNHLDIEAIDWLEEFFLNYSGTLLFITHDRAFLRRLATRIVELDRGQLTSWPGDYDTYLRRKEEALAAEEKQQALFDKRLAQEEAWIRQGIKARRTRNEGRVRALKKMREERSHRREQLGSANLALSDAERSGKVVIEAEGINHAFGERTLIKDLSVTVMRGDRIGLIGPNGVGKTTLLKILLGEQQPDSGTVKLGTNLQVAYFDQLRGQLDESGTVLDNVAEGREQVTVGGKSRHVMSYLQDFLFEPDRARGPISMLSGGERNRLLLAKLFLKPANLLVMDEPTNDLDVETLELLEEKLIDYQGTLLLVSHDREFLDNVVTSTLVFEGEGSIGDYVGGYSDWLRQRRGAQSAPSAAGQSTSPKQSATRPEQSESGKQGRKLSYKLQRELDALPERIESLEQELEQLHTLMSDPAFYQQESSEIAVKTKRVEEVEGQLEQAYSRWDELESGE